MMMETQLKTDAVKAVLRRKFMPLNASTKNEEGSSKFHL